MTATRPGRAEPRTSVRRCRDGATIARIVERDYFDDPIRFFPKRLKRAFARSWLATRRETYFMIVEVDGAYAGFVFTHTMGDGLLRRFARRRPHHLPALMLARWKAEGKWPPFRPSRPEAAPGATRATEAEIASLDVPSDSRRFQWSAADGRTGRVSLLFVDPAYRGLGLAPQLLNGLAEHMARDGVEVIEAHVDADNLASVRAFLKAGYAVRRMADRDFHARKRIAR